MLVWYQCDSPLAPTRSSICLFILLSSLLTHSADAENFAVNLLSWQHTHYTTPANQANALTFTPGWPRQPDCSLTTVPAQCRTVSLCATALAVVCSRASALHCAGQDHCTPLLHRLIDGPGPAVHSALPALYISWQYLPEMNGPSHCTAQQQSHIVYPAAAALGLEVTALGLSCRLSLLCTAGTQSDTVDWLFHQCTPGRTLQVSSSYPSSPSSLPHNTG